MNQANHNQKHAEWIKRIEDAFVGPGNIVGERSLIFARNENERQATAPFVHHGFFARLMDAFFDFSVKSFETTTRKPELYDMSLLISALWTLRSAYNQFWQGYYCQATGLLRSAFESIALLIGEKNGCLNRFQLCQFMEDGNKRHKAPWEMGPEGKKLVDQAVKCLFKVNAGLSSADNRALKEFYRLLHSHVHLSFWSFFRLFKRGKETGTIGILPKADDADGNRFIVASEAIAWAHLRLQMRVEDIPPSDEHYILLNAAFAFAVSNCTNVAFRDAWTKMLEERFVNGKG